MAGTDDEHRGVSQYASTDAFNMAGLLYGLPEQLEEAQSLVVPPHARGGQGKLRNVVLTGMGGSAIVGDLLRCVAQSDMKAPMVVVRDYQLPAFVDEGTLLMAVSYSGNTEETLSAFQQGIEKGAMAYVITSGGRLGELSEKRGIPCVHIPSGLPPRCALGYLFIPALLTLSGLGVIPRQRENIKEAILILRELRKCYAPLSGVGAYSNTPLQLAAELKGKVTIIYDTAGTTEGVALRWKTQLNENSKTYAACNTIPEMNHNEIAGWEALPELSSRTVAIFLRDAEEHPSASRRIEMNKAILKEKGLTVKEFWSRGKSRLARVFSLIYLGDYTSYYLAQLYGIDPTPVNIIEELKKADRIQ